MRTPSALDAMARWLVLTLAALGLFALVPGTSFAAPGFSSARWLVVGHPVQVGALVMMALAWVLLVVHVLQWRARWRRDGVSVLLAAAAAVAVVLCVGSFLWGEGPVVAAGLTLLLATHAALCVRIDRVERGVAGPVRPPKRTRAATAL